MGYVIHQISSSFTLPAGKATDALNALKQLRGLETCGAADHKHFMWINDSSEFLNASSLEEALQMWRWRATPDEDGGVAGLEFVGESRGDEDLLFQALAPFVDEGSYIAVVGEDDAVWRWFFSRGVVRKQAGHISFGDFDGCRQSI